jgi:DNA mismatch repair protein MutS
LERLRPAEIIFPGESATLHETLKRASGIVLPYDDWTFAPETAGFTLREHFKVVSLDGFGLRGRTAAIGAGGAVLHYLTQHLRRDCQHLTSLHFYQPADFLLLDATTLRHLEILEPLHRDAPRNACLYGAVHRPVTPMGARRLRDWLSQPLADVDAITRRQDAVEVFLRHSELSQQFSAQLAEVRDLERTIGRLSVGSGNARDLVALRTALEQLPKLRTTLSEPEQASRRIPDQLGGLEASRPEPSRDEANEPTSLLRELTTAIQEQPQLVELIARAIAHEPPLALKEGGLIRDGFCAELDELRAASRGGKDWIAQLQQQEIERTGITSLKVRFNSVFGYFIEVTKSNLAKVPAHYTRKQTVANGERFITPELKEMESKILGAEERSVKLEYDLFLKVREEALQSLQPIQSTADALAQLDVLAAFAESARLHNYVRPLVADEGILRIRDGRHPVLDQTLVESRFVPNDTALAGCAAPSSPSPPSGERAGVRRQAANAATASPSTTLKHHAGALLSEGEREHIRAASERGAPQITLITGPNMAGKSTYIRQVALLTLLAHTGSFIPVAEARIDLVDRIFTRIGASDDLARGQSTFLVEMSETANILHNATARSLIILDEIGRGTSTFDGLSLAWSIVEHLHNQVGAKTLFATHYHELTELARRLPRLKNFNVAVREWNDQVVFLHKIVDGGADKSYGIQVARLAGVPKRVVERAKEILRNLEESELTPEGAVRQPSRRQRDREKLQQIALAPQLDLFAEQ